MKNFKLSTLISLTLALLLAFSLVTGCATSQSGKTDEATLSDDTVRVPPADPTAFWSEAARLVDWSKPYERVLDDSNAPFYRWFAG